MLTSPVFFPTWPAQSAREVRMVSALFSSHTLYLTLLSTPITPYRVFTPVNSAVAVPAESGTYQSVLEFLKNIELIVSCLLVCVVGLDEAGVGEGLPGQLALLPCLSPQLTLTEDILSLQHITDELHLVYILAKVWVWMPIPSPTKMITFFARPSYLTASSILVRSCLASALQ